MTSWSHIILKSSTVGAVGAIASRFVIGAGTFRAFGMSMPIWAATLIAVGFAGVAGELIGHYAFPYIGGDKWAQPSAGWTITALDGLATMATFYLENSGSLGPGGVGALYAFGLGAGSYILGDYAYRMIVEPFWGVTPTGYV